MADKDFELSDCKERIAWLERKIENLEKDFHEKESKYLEEIAKLKNVKYDTEKKIEEMQHFGYLNNDIAINKLSNEHREVKGELILEFSINFTFQMIKWKEEAERWRSECELLRSKPQSNEQLTEYYESQLREILEIKQAAVSETKTLWGENAALYSRLEHLIMVNKDLENSLEKSNEELIVTIENYKSQLDAMTEHLAAQNDKITKQCDEIQALKHKIANKK